jgi:hypothetical protein
VLPKGLYFMRFLQPIGYGVIIFAWRIGDNAAAARSMRVQNGIPANTAPVDPFVDYVG